MFAAVMIRFNLGRTFCAGAMARGVVVVVDGGAGIEKNTSPRSALLLCSRD